MNGQPSRLTLLGLVVALVAVAALIGGVRLAAGTTTVGPATVTAQYGSDAKALIVLVAIGIAAAGLLATWTRSARMALIAAAAVAGSGAAALAEVWSCVQRWHAQAAQASVDSGYGTAGATNHYGHGVEIVVAGGVLAIVAAVVIAAGARTPRPAFDREGGPATI